MKVAVIGAGWAGLAAAVELADMGVRVDVFEASRTLGGRARAVTWNGIEIDNGQHILIGAYRETLRLMRKIGADPDTLLKRIPLRLEFPGEFRLVAPRLPAPLHTAAALLTAKGIDWREKWAAISLMRTLQRNGYQVSPDTTVDGWLDAHQVPSRQRRLLWEPLCVAALNTVSNIASAQMLANVLRDSLGGPRAASDLLLPKVSLSALFPQPAANFIQARGNTVRHGQRVDSIRKTDDGWRLGSGEIYQHVIVATAPYHVAGILGDHAPDLAQMEWEPIVTSYLQYPPSFRLPQAMLGLVDGHAQWLFDRGQLCGQKGLVAAVISARGRHLQLETTELEARIAAEICRVAGDDAKPVGSITITEKRATFSATPGLRRPVHKLCRGLWLAGDAVAGDYPATLEGAVRAGISVADGILSGG